MSSTNFELIMFAPGLENPTNFLILPVDPQKSSFQAFRPHPAKRENTFTELLCTLAEGASGHGGDIPLCVVFPNVRSISKMVGRSCGDA